MSSSPESAKFDESPVKKPRDSHNEHTATSFIEQSQIQIVSIGLSSNSIESPVKVERANSTMAPFNITSRRFEDEPTNRRRNLFGAGSSSSSSTLSRTSAGLPLLDPSMFDDFQPFLLDPTGIQREPSNRQRNLSGAGYSSSSSTLSRTSMRLPLPDPSVFDNTSSSSRSMQQPSLVNVPRRQESPPLSHQPLHQSHSSTVAFGTPPSSPVRQVAVLPPIAETQTEAVETNTIDEATHELVLNLTAGRIIKFESSAVTQSEQQKKVVPAKFYDGTRWLPSMAIITTRPIRQSPAVVAALGIFATTTFEGKTIQLSPRGISLFNSLRIGREIEGSQAAKLGFYLASVFEAFTPLEQLHQSGVAHMDLKPSNIVVIPTGTTLIDSATPPVFRSTTFDNDIHFSSPTRPHESSIDGDIYSLGVTLNRIYDNFKSSGIELSPLRGLIHDMTEHSKRDRPTGQEVKARLTSIIQTVDAEGERHAIKARFFEHQDGFLNTESPTFYTSADIPNQALEE